MENRTERRQIILEDIFIILSILALWPMILGWDEAVFQALKYITLAGLVYIFIRRLRRYKGRDRSSGTGAGNSGGDGQRENGSGDDKG